MDREKFLRRFSPGALKKLKGEELLRTIAAPKSSEYEDSLKYVLENELTEDYGSYSARSDTHFKLAFRDSNWRHFENSIDKSEAIIIANKITEMLSIAYDFLNNNDFDGFYNYTNNPEIRKEKLFNKGYIHKYLHIIFPKYISFFHAQNWQDYYKNALSIKSRALFSLEKSFIEKYGNNIDMTKESGLLVKKYGTPKDKKDNILNEGYNMEKFPLNQILYGPPGSGKTYNTIVKAMEIIDKKEYFKKINDKEYEDLRNDFKKLKNEGRIEFITFHQSYSYEEFVEGIRPETDNGQVIYNIKSGIFKKICEEAQTKVCNNFEEAYDAFLNDIIESGDNFPLNTLKRKAEFKVSVNNNGNLNLFTKEKQQGVITKENLKKHFLKIRTSQDWNGYYDGILHYLETQYNLKSKQNKEEKPYILIIDEINRGNISKIFGELITLIEEDKRKGAVNELEVNLPYSNELFSVPKNLYIIGTMNTSDRSIASIDIALRRRFKFIEIMPDSKLVSNIKLDNNTEFKKVFESLNEKISILLDRDHQIGHSYFMPEKAGSIADLKQIWFDSIIPLLNEYFYNDWEKLNLIIPEFIENKKDCIPKKLKNECEEYFEFKTIKDFETDEKFIQALLEICTEKEDKDN